MSRESIANALRRLRIRAGLTTKQVGELVGKSSKTVSAWENNRGQPDAEILMQLCDIYDVDDILAEFRDEENPDINKKRASAEAEAKAKKLIDIYLNLSPQNQAVLDALLHTMIEQQEKED